MHDAVVIGAGHNGLVAANLLADAGWSVLVLEATEHPGGAVRTAERASFSAPLRSPVASRSTAPRHWLSAESANDWRRRTTSRSRVASRNSIVSTRR